LGFAESDSNWRIVVCIHCGLHCGYSLSEGWFLVNTSVQIFSETSFMPIAWKIAVAPHVVCFFVGGVGGGSLPPTPLPEKISLGIFPRDFA
jgi:uncharacterized membrane protein